MFITLEGIDGVGKSVAAYELKNKLEESGHRVKLLCDPGLTEIGKSVNHIVKHDKLSNPAQLALFLAARGELIEKEILPALNSGQSVICDRFTDSTIAYQCGGFGIPYAYVKDLIYHPYYYVKPDITFLLWSKRLHLPKGDVIESMGKDFYTRVSDTYDAIAAAYRDRVIRIQRVEGNVDKTVDKMTDILWGMNYL